MKKCHLHFANQENGGLEAKISALAYEKKSPQEYFEEALKELTGTNFFELANEIYHRSRDAMPSKNEAENANTIVQALAENKPRDATEARLCAQEAVLYAQGMQCLYRAENENMIPQCEHYLKNAVKLLRLHNETIEALNKYRRGGEQRVVVQHVQVSDGGKAVVNGVFDGGG